MSTLQAGMGRRRLVAIFAVVLTVLLGALIGVGAFTFGYGKGWSYLSNNPTTCANCHVMQGHFDSWQNSSHRHVAVCNDCHLPHAPVGKWVTKVDNGFFHSLAFTLENFHEPIQIKPRTRRVTQHACVYCHSEVVSSNAAYRGRRRYAALHPLPQRRGACSSMNGHNICMDSGSFVCARRT